jgi:hypothetical protein
MNRTADLVALNIPHAIRSISLRVQALASGKQTPLPFIGNWGEAIERAITEDGRALREHHRRTLRQEVKALGEFSEDEAREDDQAPAYDGEADDDGSAKLSTDIVAATDDWLKTIRSTEPEQLWVEFHLHPYSRQHPEAKTDAQKDELPSDLNIARHLAGESRRVAKAEAFWGLVAPQHRSFSNCLAFVAAVGSALREPPSSELGELETSLQHLETAFASLRTATVQGHDVPLKDLFLTKVLRKYRNGAVNRSSDSITLSEIIAASIERLSNLQVRVPSATYDIDFRRLVFDLSLAMRNCVGVQPSPENVIALMRVVARSRLSMEHEASDRKHNNSLDSESKADARMVERMVKGKWLEKLNAYEQRKMRGLKRRDRTGSATAKKAAAQY